MPDAILPVFGTATKVVLACVIKNTKIFTSLAQVNKLIGYKSDPCLRSFSSMAHWVVIPSYIVFSRWIPCIIAVLYERHSTIPAWEAIADPSLSCLKAGWFHPGIWVKGLRRRRVLGGGTHILCWDQLLGVVTPTKLYHVHWRKNIYDTIQTQVQFSYIKFYVVDHSHMTPFELHLHLIFQRSDIKPRYVWCEKGLRKVTEELVRFYPVTSSYSSCSPSHSYSSSSYTSTVQIPRVQIMLNKC